MLELKATNRIKKTNVDKLRNEGQIPAVCYGSGHENLNVSISQKEFSKIFKEAGETSTVNINVEGKKIPTMVKFVQRDPVKGVPTHVDFYVVNLKKEIEVAVPLEFIGLAEAEKAGLGTLMKVLHEIEVSALPNDLPHAIEIDVTPIVSLEDKICVSDIKLPNGVTLKTNPEEVIAFVAPYVEEKEEAPVDLSAIEVEEKGKKDEEETETE